MPAKRSPKLPPTQQTTFSPGDTRFATADSSPPEPDDENRITWFRVSKTCLTPAGRSFRTAANSGPRWSIIGLVAARTTRSGSGAGPGIRSCCWKIIGQSLLRRTCCSGPGRGTPRPYRVGSVGRRHALALPAVGGVGEEGDRPGPLQGTGEWPLVLGAGPGDPAWKDLAPLGDEPPQAADLLVVDVVDLLDAEGTDLAAGPLAPGPILSALGHGSDVLLLRTESRPGPRPGRWLLRAGRRPRFPGPRRRARQRERRHPGSPGTRSR